MGERAGRSTTEEQEGRAERLLDHVEGIFREFKDEQGIQQVDTVRELLAGVRRVGRGVGELAEALEGLGRRAASRR